MYAYLHDFQLDHMSDIAYDQIQFMYYNRVYQENRPIHPGETAHDLGSQSGDIITPIVHDN